MRHIRLHTDRAIMASEADGAVVEGVEEAMGIEEVAEEVILLHLLKHTPRILPLHLLAMHQ